MVIAGSSQSNELKLARYFQFYHVNLYFRQKKVYDIEYWKCERGFKTRAVVFSNLNKKNNNNNTQRLLKQMPMHYNSFVCVQQSKVGIQSPFAHLVLGKFARRPKMIF